MKRFPLPLCIVICVLLVLGGLVYGNVGGYVDSRARVEKLLTEEGGLDAVLFNRGCDGRNLLVIARRYLPEEDEDLTAVREAADVLCSGASAEEKREADSVLTASANALNGKIRGAKDFPSRPDDDNNLRILLERDLGMADTTASALRDYNAAAESFNARLDEKINGFLARLLGVKPCPLYE